MRRYIERALSPRKTVEYLPIQRVSVQKPEHRRTHYFKCISYRNSRRTKTTNKRNESSSTSSMIFLQCRNCRFTQPTLCALDQSVVCVAKSWKISPRNLSFFFSALPFRLRQHLLPHNKASNVCYQIDTRNASNADDTVPVVFPLWCLFSTLMSTNLSLIWSW